MDVMGINPKAGKRRATLKEIAAELGVAPSTVSNAYNRPDQLSPALRERVFEAARRLGYPGPDPMARGLRRRRAGAVGVIYEHRLSYAFSDPAAVLFLQGVSVATEEAGLGLLLLSGTQEEGQGPEDVAGAVVDGFVVYSMAEGDERVATALERRLPVVVVDQPWLENVPFVGIDDEGGARLAAEHLIGLGHRRFGVVTFALAPDMQEGPADVERQRASAYRLTRSRLRGYASAIAGAGIPWEEVPVYERAFNDRDRGRRAAEHLLSRDPRPTAILAVSDQLALGVLEAADRLGLSVPADVSVVGFDDVPEAARSRPPLTTVRQPHFEKGLAAGRALVAGIQDQEYPGPELLPTRLVVRGSTAEARDV